MVEPGKSRLKKKKKRVSSKMQEEYFKGKPSKKKCAITGKVLSGVASEKKGKICKKSKTQRRPSVPFGGVLGGEGREQVFIELGKVVNGSKKIVDVDMKYRKYVEQAMKRAE